MSLHWLYGLDRSSSQFPDLLYQLLHDTERVQCLQNLPNEKLVQLLDYLNDVLDQLDHTSQPFRKCLQVLQKICSFRMTLPTSCQMSGTLSFTSEVPVVSGGFGDVYRGILNGGADICIKRIRISSADDKEKLKQSFCKEAVVWKHLSHRHIVPFMGVTFEPLQLVSGWMAGGELRNYIKENPHTNLTSLLLGVAEGLAYLHSCNVIHGDLKGPNVMVDKSGNARLVDFGLAAIARNPHSLRSTLDEGHTTARWCAPEVLTGEECASKESDIFSFGMVIIEVFTGKAPFAGSAAPTVVLGIMGGKRPERPNHASFTDNLWNLTRKCLEQAPSDRPKVEQVLETLRKSAIRTAFASPTPPGGSFEREAVSTNPSTTFWCGPGTRDISPKPRTDRGRRDAPDQVDFRPSQTPKGDMSGTSTPISPHGTSVDRLVFVPTMTPPEAVSIQSQPQPQAETKKHGLWCRLRKSSCSAQ